MNREETGGLLIGLKYCGCCNPHLDIPSLVQSIQKQTKGEEVTFVPWWGEGIGLMLILCGCPRACGDTEEVRKKAARNIVVAGEAMDYHPVPETELARALARKIELLLSNNLLLSSTR